MDSFLTHAKCQDHTNKKLFGLCDDPALPNAKAFLDEQNGKDWIAVIQNNELSAVTFTAIDNCISLNNEDGTMAKRCDGCLTYDSTIAFVELKTRNDVNNSWIKDGESQLKSAISFFEKTIEASLFTKKSAYIANSARPRFRESSITRMDNFLLETGYVLRIVNRINID